MWQAQVESPLNPDFKLKGDDIQKLSVIETLPQLLAEDAHSCITRVLPKIQQSLPTASTEFHMAASLIFKQVLEQRLVSHSTFTEVFLQSILNSLENREPVISHAWLETILDVIELLPVDIIKQEILPIAVSEGQISQSVNSRITCCRLMGKIATRFDPISVKKDILPTVQSLCQDVNNDVRACICLQLRYIAEGVGSDVTKLLPFLVELADDEESIVRQAAVQTIGHLLPQLHPDTVKDIIVPLIKIACENALKTEDNLICVIAQEFGKLAQSSETFLTSTDKTWFIKYFIQLSQMGIPSTNVEESKQDFSFITANNVQINDRSIQCRRNCAFNMPAMFLFASSTVEGINSLIPTFRNLANDSYYMVRRTIACSLHEIMKILGSKSGLIKTELVRLLKDDHEEVLQGLIPHISGIFEHLLQNQLIGMDLNKESSTIDLGRALIKCEAEISLTNNWRLSALMLNQFEMLPKCFPSDFIYTYLVPIVTNRVLNSRPLPVRLAAGRTLLILLRFNLKPQQRIEIRNQICIDFAHGSSCYVRMVFIHMMIECMSIFSSVYFKEHFCRTLLSLLEDSVANVRLKVITIVPTIKSCLRLPADKKLLSTLETNVRNLMNNEKDRDVAAALIEAARQMESIEVRVDSQPSPTKLSRYDSDDMKKYEEEKKLEAMSSGKTGLNIGSLIRKPNMKGKVQANNESPKSSVPSKPAMIRQNSSMTRRVPEVSKASTSSDNFSSNWSRLASNNLRLTEPWERATSACHNTNLTSTNPSYNSSQDVECSCYELAERIFRKQTCSSNSSEENYRSNWSQCSCLNDSNYLKTTNLFDSKHDYRFPDLSKASLLTNVRDDKHDIWQDLMLTRSSFASKYRMPDFGGFQSNYNPYWSFSSMPEIPVTLVDDEFMVDAGIKIPSQLASSQSTSKIPNLQDIIYRKKKMSSSLETRRRRSAYSASAPASASAIASASGSGSASASTGFGFGSTKRFPSELDESQESGSDGIRSYKFELASDDKKQQQQHDSMKLPAGPAANCKESKLAFKRHSMQLAEYNARELRRFSTLDVNHNQGNISKIPVRSCHLSGISASRTPPVTRTSSPVRLLDSDLLQKLPYSARLRTFPSLDRPQILTNCTSCTPKHSSTPK